MEQLRLVRGVGAAKAAQLVAAFEMGRRATMEAPEPGELLISPESAIQAARRHLSGRRREHFIALLLDTRHRLLRTIEVSVGSIDMSIVHPRETFREAIAAGAAAMIVAHNHPSGDPAPSAEDLDLTRRLVEAGKLLGIPVLDHLIIGRVNGISLREGGFVEER